MNDLFTALVEARTVDAHLGVDSGEMVLTMHHDLPCTPDVAFQLLTDPRLTEGWSPIVADRALDTVGPATSRETPDDEPVDAEVLAVDPPRHVRHRWGLDILDWTVSPHEAGSRVLLRDHLGDPTLASTHAAGWHLCFAGLEARAGGKDAPRPVGKHALGYGWQQLRDSYDVLFAQQV